MLAINFNHAEFNHAFMDLALVAGIEKVLPKLCTQSWKQDVAKMSWNKLNSKE